MDIERVLADAETPRSAETVARAARLADDLGIDGTAAFVAVGRHGGVAIFRGQTRFEELAAAIDR